MVTTAPPSVSPALPTLTHLDSLLHQYEQDAIAANLSYTSGTPRGPVSGLPKLDRELGGLLTPGVHIIHGGPGVGKTAFALQVAALCQCPALFVSTEMGTLELFRRLVARLTGTFLGKLKSGELAPATSLVLAKRTAVALPLLVLADGTRAFAPPDWIGQAAEATRGAGKDVLVVIDSVHAWADGAPGNLAEYDALNEALTRLQQLGATLQCPVLGIAQRNRASMATGGLHASAGTRRFEYGSESVLDLNVDKNVPPTLQGETAVTLTIQKNRNGSPGRDIKLLFHGALQSFKEV